MNPTDALFHRHLVAAYTVTWVIHLAYLAYVGWKGRQSKRAGSK